MISTMLHVKVDRDEPTELHEQVAGEIRRAIADGEAKPGERLPPAKDLAAVLGVNTNTVLRALRELRDEGLLEFRRGRGITVAAAPDAEVAERARDLVRFARRTATGSTSSCGSSRASSPNAPIRRCAAGPARPRSSTCRARCSVRRLRVRPG